MIEIRNQKYICPDETRPTKIVAAAILHKGNIWTGRSHGDLIFQILIDTDGDYFPIGEEQGFLTDDNRFVTRSAAKHIAIKAGQLPEGYKYILTSEDLW